MNDTKPKESGMHPLAFVLVMVVVFLGFMYGPRLFVGRGKLAGEAAPDFSAKVVLNGEGDQKSIVLSSLKGKAVVLDFWATWCGPCRQEAPIMNQIAARYKDKGVVVVGVNTDDSAGNAEVFAKQMGLRFPIAYDADRSAAAAYDVHSLPTLVVISRSGKVIVMRAGLTSESDLVKYIEEALAS